MTAVVSAYTERRWDDLVACVGALAGQSRPLDQIIVVIDDDASAARTCPARVRVGPRLPNAKAPAFPVRQRRHRSRDR